MTLFPIPKELTYREGTCPAGAAVTEKRNAAYQQEEYLIEIAADGITLTAATDEGIFRAKSTMKQIYGQNGETLPCLTLHDWPDYPVRGLWYNFSARTPNVETLKRQIDIMADMKINHLQIEIHPGDYDFQSYPMMRVCEAPIKPEELKELSAYAHSRFMDLVPCIQTFGHMDTWLKHPAFNDMAECPDGFEIWGGHRGPGTLDPKDPRSRALANGILDEILPLFDEAKTVNLGCDETWDLGVGKSKELCEKLGRTRVFLDFVKDTIAHAEEKGFKPLFWADIIVQGSQEVINDIPKNAVALNWGYERIEVKEENCIKLQKSGVPYWNCPGTRNWCSLIGESYTAIQNIARSAVLGKRYGASGLLNTDWPDHAMHHFSPSYFGIAYGAAMGWTVAESDWRPVEGDDGVMPIQQPYASEIVKLSPTAAACFDFLNRFVYEDKNGMMAQLAYDAGMYGDRSTHASQFNITTVKAVLVHSDAFVGHYDEADFRSSLAYLDNILFRLDHEPDMRCADARYIHDEYRDSINILRWACKLGLYNLGIYDGMTKEGYEAMMNAWGKDIYNEHLRVYDLRNRGSFGTRAARYLLRFDRQDQGAKPTYGE